MNFSGLIMISGRYNDEKYNMYYADIENEESLNKSLDEAISLLNNNKRVYIYINKDSNIQKESVLEKLLIKLNKDENELKIRDVVQTFYGNFFSVEMNK